jgi:hypothetical protein
MDVRIAVHPLEQVGVNEKGYTYAYEKGANHKGMLAAIRYAGSINGCHFHKGLSAEKNPELLLLIGGRANLFGKDLQTGKANNWVLSEPSAVYIYPWVWHELEALTDCYFLEFNSLAGHQADTFYEIP